MELKVYVKNEKIKILKKHEMKVVRRERGII